MSSTVSPHRLTRRLVNSYLFHGLACVLSCIFVLVVMLLRGNSELALSISTAISLAMLVAGTIVLKRTIRVPCLIEYQLRCLTSSPEQSSRNLERIKDDDPIANNWNRIVGQLCREKKWESLEQHLQATLNSSHSRLWEQAIDSLSDGIAITGRSNKIDIANQSFLSFVNAEHIEQVIGCSMESTLHDMAPESDQQEVSKLINATGPCVGELKLGKDIADGIRRVGRLPILVKGQLTDDTVWYIRDVTQQKLAEEVRSQFVSTATHELRTPLANIKAYAETLSLDNQLDFEKQKGFYNIISAEATRLSRFIDDLLDVSQMEAASILIDRHETDLERLLTEVIAHVQPQIQQKQLGFDRVFPPKIPKLQLDKDKISSALVNLLGNAIKYTPEHGKVRVLVEVTSEFVFIHVEDTGIGISADQIPRIGEKFFRADDTRIQGITGSGLGVAFAQEVAQLHGGRLSILSEIDKGSRFSISLPRTISDLSNDV